MKNKLIIISALVGFSILVPVGCATPDIAKLQATQMDQEMIKDFDPSKAEFENVNVIIATNAKRSLGSAYQEAIESATYEMVTGLGGVEAVDRGRTKTMLQEAAFQESGLVDVSKIKIGNIKGATYLIASGLTDAGYNQVFSPASKVCDLKGRCVTRDAHWKTTVYGIVDFRVIELETTKVVLSKSFKNEYSNKSSNKLDMASINSLLPKALNYVFEDAKPELQKIFPVKGVVLAMRGEKKVAMISLGTKHKMKPGREFGIIDVMLQKTAVGTKKFFNEIGKIELFRVDEDESWGKISGDKEKIKVGMEVHAKPEVVGIFTKIKRFIISIL